MTGREPRIREATPADVAELARLRWDACADEQAGVSRAAFLRDCAAWFHETLANDRWVLAVVETDAGLSGCMFLQCVAQVPTPTATHRAWGYVTNAFVDPQARGHGSGERLLRLLIAVARERRLEFLIVWPSEAAVAFYQRAGFRPVSDVHVGPDDEPPLELMLAVAPSRGEGDHSA